MKKFMKKHWKLILLALEVIVILPVIIQWTMSSGLADVSGGSDDGWLGFWGGYLGALVAIPASVGIALYSVESSKRTTIQERYNGYYEKISEAATKYKVKSKMVSRFSANDISNGTQVVRINQLVWDQVSKYADSFLYSININLAKLPESKRDFCNSKLDQFAALRASVIDFIVNNADDLNFQLKIIKDYEATPMGEKPSVDKKSYQICIKNYRGYCKQLFSELIEIEEVCGKISDDSINLIDQ